MLEVPHASDRSGPETSGKTELRVVCEGTSSVRFGAGCEGRGTETSTTRTKDEMWKGHRKKWTIYGRNGSSVIRKNLNLNLRKLKIHIPCTRVNNPFNVLSVRIYVNVWVIGL